MTISKSSRGDSHYQTSGVRAVSIPDQVHGQYQNFIPARTSITRIADSFLAEVWTVS